MGREKFVLRRKKGKGLRKGGGKEAQVLRKFRPSPGEERRCAAQGVDQEKKNEKGGGLLAQKERSLGGTQKERSFAR